MDIFIICIVFSLFFLSGAIFFVIFPTFTHYLCIFTLKNARFWHLPATKMQDYSLKLIYMKKHLLTLVLITLVSLTANAQTVYESLKGQPVHVVSGNGTIDHSLSATQTSVAAPMCKAEGEGGTKVPLEYLFVNGADVPFGADGFPEAPGSNAVFGRITADKLKPYADYSIVGIAFIVASDLGSVPSIIAMERRTDG